MKGSASSCKIDQASLAIKPSQPVWWGWPNSARRPRWIHPRAASRTARRAPAARSPEEEGTWERGWVRPSPRQAKRILQEGLRLTLWVMCPSSCKLCNTLLVPRCSMSDCLNVTECDPFQCPSRPPFRRSQLLVEDNQQLFTQIHTVSSGPTPPPLIEEQRRTLTTSRKSDPSALPASGVSRSTARCELSSSVVKSCTGSGSGYPLRCLMGSLPAAWRPGCLDEEAEDMDDHEVGQAGPTHVLDLFLLGLEADKGKHDILSEALPGPKDAGV